MAQNVLAKVSEKKLPPDYQVKMKCYQRYKSNWDCWIYS